ncbi:Polar amino acid ABC transporter substrate-binding protein [Frankia canadensis]|uniref:Polar amino acid ABC transporter substrate-binding protein n=1 Tax=Frankia canadensis TaxID=1836972 RepID=A0A2I2KJG3_9ACTN|nr:ABC transporter substrate-binding protein [Frankia canadensis]SNQ45811.1 Polar amino acid ABC transporter substrate-binding protein [Frankia canadensis]SOU53101.1 Polar amino acid ABC transporter substrate-binding protein [Frankia canadensis]
MIRPTVKAAVATVAAVAAMALATSACSSSGGGTPSAGGTPASTGASSASSALHDMLPENIKKSGVVHLATDAEYPPCETLENGKMVGYEPDLWNAMAAKLGVRVDATSIAFDSLIPGVQSGRYDMAMECISDNTEREKQVTFVDNAYATGAVYTLATNTSITTDPLTLCGLKTATQQGLDLAEQITSTINPHCASSGKPPVEIQQFPSANAALLALYSGRVDFVLNDYAAAEALQKAAPKPLRYVTDPLLQKYYNGMVFNKKATELQQAFLGALKTIIADGSYDKIMSRWDLPALELTKPGINLAASDPIPAPKP